jgi:hypothetical protein
MTTSKVAKTNEEKLARMLDNLNRKIRQEADEPRKNFGRDDLKRITYLVEKKLKNPECCLVLRAIYFELKNRISALDEKPRLKSTENIIKDLIYRHKAALEIEIPLQRFLDSED